jgi:glycerophosphoryl diester phosphodiesterase
MNVASPRKTEMFARMAWLAGAASIFLLAPFGAQAAGNRIHANAHSHNDYLQARPLLDALAQNFCGVEADIYLVNGKLLVAHELNHTDPDRTLEKLYLAPLSERVKMNGGRVHPNGPGILLLIDIKTEGTNVFPVLQQQLEKYKSMLTWAENGVVHTNAVTVVLSGDRPRELLKAQTPRFAFFDGRFEDVGQVEKPSFMPLISDNWQKYIAWKGEGPVPDTDRAALKNWVQRVHAEGKQIRLWGAPDNPAAWQLLLDAGADWVNTDHLPELASFLQKSGK